MKTKYYTIRNVEEAIQKMLEANSGYPPRNFLKALEETKPSERENIVIATIESE